MGSVAAGLSPSYSPSPPPGDEQLGTVGEIFVDGQLLVTCEQRLFPGLSSAADDSCFVDLCLRLVALSGAVVSVLVL